MMKILNQSDQLSPKVVPMPINFYMDPLRINGRELFYLSKIANWMQILH